MFKCSLSSASLEAMTIAWGACSVSNCPFRENLGWMIYKWYEVLVRSGKGVADPAQGRWMDYCLLKVTYCPVCSLLWILCLPSTTQTDVLTLLLSPSSLGAMQLSLQHSWPRTLPTGAFPREHMGQFCTHSCQSDMPWHVLSYPLEQEFCCSA